MSCARTRDVGSLVLDLLDPAEAARLEEHARTCPECSEAVADLRPVAALMEHADAPAAPPDELAFRRFQAAVHRRRSHRALLLTAVAAVLVLTVVGAVTAVSLAGRPSGTAVSARQGPVGARVVLRAVESGTSLHLSLRGVEPGQRCELVAVARDGHQEVAGTWLASYTGDAGVDGGVSVRPRDIDHLVVQTLDGKVLLTLPLQLR